MDDTMERNRNNSSILSDISAFAFTLLSVAMSTACGEVQLADEPPIAEQSTAVVGNQAKQTSRLRVLTMNARLLSPIFTGVFAMDDHASVDRAYGLASHILHAAAGYDGVAYDVVALNEVWDEDYKEILINELKYRFPYYISYIGDADFGNVDEDSGLMLFSRFPFENLAGILPPASTNYEAKGNPPPVELAPSLWRRILFHEYMNCAYTLEDCASTKGVGFVRIRHPADGWYYNLFFTHLQADNNIGTATARYAQYQELQQFHNGVKSGDPLTAAWGAKSTTLFMGDFNAEGNMQLICGAAFPSTCNIRQPPASFQTPPPPWTSLINPANGVEMGAYFGNEYGWFLRDPWRPDPYSSLNLPPLQSFDAWATTSVADAGVTWTKTAVQGRYDYFEIMKANVGTIDPGNSATWNFACPQWIRTAAKGMSDHNGLALELAPAVPACMPSIAFRPESAPQWSSKKEAILPGTLRPGSNQWYYFKDPGTFEIGMTAFKSAAAKGVTFDVFTEEDLGSPLTAYKNLPPEVDHSQWCDELKEGEGGCSAQVKVFSFNKPFYIRVYDPRGLWNDEYKLFVKKHDCSSKTLGCILRPGAPFYDPAPPDNKNFHLWFRMDTDEAFGGGAQNTKLRIEPKFGASSVPGTPYTATLRNAQGVTMYSSPVATTQTTFFPRSTTGGETLWLEVERFDLTKSFRVRWTTNLTYVFGGIAPASSGIPACAGGVPGYEKGLSYSNGAASPMQLFCIEETDEVGSDEIFLWPSADGVQYPNTFLTGSGNGAGPCELAMTGSDMDEGDSMNLMQMVPTAFVDHYSLAVFEEDDGFGGGGEMGAWTRTTLDENKMDLLNQAVDIPIDGGTYRFFFNLSHQVY